jgi:hypothetical protein
MDKVNGSLPNSSCGDSGMSATVSVMAKKRKAAAPEPAPESAPTPTRPKTDAIRIDYDLAEMIRLMASKRRIDIADLISPLVRAIIEREYDQFLAELTTRKPPS